MRRSENGVFLYTCENVDLYIIKMELSFNMCSSFKFLWNDEPIKD